MSEDVERAYPDPVNFSGVILAVPARCRLRGMKPRGGCRNCHGLMFTYTAALSVRAPGGGV